MKKSLISLAVLAGMAASSAAMAITPYVRIHMSLDSWDEHDPAQGFTSSTAGPALFGGAPSAKEDLDLMSRKSVFGVKGSEDAGGGNKVFYKLEWEVRPDTSAGSGFASGRDQFIGLKFGQGSVKIGTMTNNYKETGMAIDKLKHTGLEARGFLNMQSQAHAGKGINGGRQTETIQYRSPKMGGMQLVVNRTFNSTPSLATPSSSEETTGVGFRAGGKSWSAFFDYIDMVCGGDGAGDFALSGYGIATCATTGTESGFKVGGKVNIGKSGSVAVQIEDVADIKTEGTTFTNTDAGEYSFLQGVFNVDKNNSVILSYGMEGDISNGFALAFMHKTGAKSHVYVGYGDRSDDTPAPAAGNINEQSLLTAGWSASFQ